VNKENKTIIIDKDHVIFWEDISSIAMEFDIDDHPCLVINKDKGNEFVIQCRNTNTVGCAICAIGTFLNNTYCNHMDIGTICNFEATHVVEFKMETWHESIGHSRHQG